MEKPIEFLYKLVKISSVSGHEAAAVEFICDEAAQRGFLTKIDEAGNFIGRIGDGKKQIVLLGHIDTVPGGPTVEIRDNILYGRGSVDAKGPLATFLMAAYALSQTELWQSNLKHEWQLIIVGAVEEELSTSKGANFIKDKYHPEYCIIGEPGDWASIVLGYKGCLRMTFEYAQDTAHSAGPGIGAAEYAVDYWNAVKKYAADFNADKLSMFQQLQLRIVHINTKVFEQQDVVTAEFRFRIPVGLKTDKLIRDLTHLNSAFGKINFSGAEEAYVTSRRTLLTPVFSNAVSENGGSIKFKHKTGTSDMNVVGPVWQCPIIAYGPGDSALDHTPNEHLSLTDYAKAVKILERALMDLMQKNRLE